MFRYAHDLSVSAPVGQRKPLPFMSCSIHMLKTSSLPVALREEIDHVGESQLQTKLHLGPSIIPLFGDKEVDGRRNPIEGYMSPCACVNRDMESAGVGYFVTNLLNSKDNET